MAEHGEVCPAGWKPGDKTMVADPERSLEYFESVGTEEVGGVLQAGWPHGCGARNFGVVALAEEVCCGGDPARVLCRCFAVAFGGTGGCPGRAC